MQNTKTIVALSVAMLLSSASVFAAENAAPACSTSSCGSSSSANCVIGKVMSKVPCCVKGFPKAVATDARVQNGVIISAAGLVVVYLDKRYNVVEKTVGTACNVVDNVTTTVKTKLGFGAAEVKAPAACAKKA